MLLFAAGVAAAVTGTAALLGVVGTDLRIPVALPLAAPFEPLLLAPDRLGGLFMALAGAVVALAALFGIGYAHGPRRVPDRLDGIRRLRCRACSWFRPPPTRSPSCWPGS